jgi:hypothetical protein
MAAIEEFGIHDPQQQKRLLAQRQDYRWPGGGEEAETLSRRSS